MPYEVGEPPESFVSRLARINRVWSAETLCGDMGIGFGNVLAGRSEALLRLAELVGMDPAPLLGAACTRSGKLWTIHGQTLSRDGLVRGGRRVCAACLRDDRLASGLPADVAPYGRTVWQVAHLRTCRVHGVAVKALPGPPVDWRAERDFAARLASCPDDLDALAQAQPRREPSPFEDYLTSRLAGVPGPDWLDGLPFHAAAKSCEVLGAVAAFGRRRNLNLLDDADWHRASAVGFRVMAGGPDAVDAFLSDLRFSHSGGWAVANGPLAWFGRLYTWLAANTGDPGHDELRRVVVRNLVENVPLSPGQKVFGKVLGERKIHSFRTAFLETGVHPTRLRKVLRFAGHLPRASDGRSDHEVTFDAVASARLLRRLASAYTFLELGPALNASRLQAKLLVDGGVLKPVLDGSDAEVGWKCYAREDVDAFLTDLRREACPSDVAPPGAYSIRSAAKRACCHSVEVVRLILERRLGRVAELRGVRGYDAMLVKIDEVRREVRGRELDGILPSAAYKLLRTNWRAVDALVENGVIRTVVRRHLANRVPVSVISHDEIKRFEDGYVSLFKAAQGFGRPPRQRRDDCSGTPIR